MTLGPAHISPTVETVLVNERTFQNTSPPVFVGTIGDFIYYLRGATNRLYDQNGTENATDRTNPNTINKLDILREIAGIILRYFEVYGGNKTTDLADLVNNTDRSVQDLNLFIVHLNNKIRDAEDAFVFGNGPATITALKAVFTLAVEAQHQHGVTVREDS